MTQPNKPKLSIVMTDEYLSAVLKTASIHLTSGCAALTSSQKHIFIPFDIRTAIL